MYSRYTVYINKLNGLGRTFESKDLNRKILRSLPKEWLPKRTAIKEAKDLRMLSIQELIGSLLSHEPVIEQVGRDDDKRRRSLSFKTHYMDFEYDIDSNSNFEKEFALTSKKFHRMLKYKNELKKINSNKANSFERDKFIQDRLPYQQTRETSAGLQNKDPQACYKCGKSGHIRSNCPLTLKAKERVMMASWSDYESELENEHAD
ncbi:unnamed protein product [Linum tenue]|nr:unnamed protein product [Linum tenue]